MNSAGLLEHDHGVLGSQVRHVTALLNGILVGSLTAVELDGEVRSQFSLLSEQVAAHFGFEEKGAFPHLSKLVPERAGELQQLAQSHRFILDALGETLVVLGSIATGELTPNMPRLIEAYERFHVAFLVHLQEEADVLREVSLQLSPDQRDAVNAQFVDA